jgi:hypothetical protein
MILQGGPFPSSSTLSLYQEGEAELRLSNLARHRQLLINESMNVQVK